MAVNHTCTPASRQSSRPSSGQNDLMHWTSVSGEIDLCKLRNSHTDRMCFPLRSVAVKATCARTQPIWRKLFLQLAPQEFKRWASSMAMTHTRVANVLSSLIDHRTQVSSTVQARETPCWVCFSLLPYILSLKLCIVDCIRVDHKAFQAITLHNTCLLKDRSGLYVAEWTHHLMFKIFRRANC